MGVARLTSGTGLPTTLMVPKEILVPGANWERHRKLSEPKSPSDTSFSPSGEIFGLSMLLPTLAHLPEWTLSCSFPTLFSSIN